MLATEFESAQIERLPHKTWTRGEVAVLEGTGLFDGTHFELVGGELIDKMGKLRPHVIGLTCSRVALEDVFGKDFVDTEAPIDVAEADNPRNEPEPDAIVLRRPSKTYKSNPGPADLALVLEVSDSTLRHDRSTKQRLYARAGIAEYWVLDINGRRLFVYRDPVGDAYQTALEFGESESVATVARPDLPIPLSSLLP
jgi:Uma2 family endonuclease